MANEEQFEFWNEGIGQWWVEEDDSMNEQTVPVQKKLNFGDDSCELSQFSIDMPMPMT